MEGREEGKRGRRERTEGREEENEGGRLNLLVCEIMYWIVYIVYKCKPIFAVAVFHMATPSYSGTLNPTESGRVYSWGDGRKGQLGHGKGELRLQATPKSSKETIFIFRELFCLQYLVSAGIN